MGFLDDLAKIALPAVAGSFLGPAAAPLFSGATGIMANPAVQNALISGGIGLLTGQKPKDALKSALLGGIGSTMFGGAGTIADQGTTAMERVDAPFSPMRGTQSPSEAAAAAREAASAGTGASQGVEAIKPKTMSAELLQGLGMADDNLLYKVLNTKLGEGAAAGLLAELLASGDKEDTRTAFEKRPYAGGLQYGKLGGINYNQGGLVQYFNQGGAMDNYPANPPRRDGPINPYEGSGTKDDVPALLTAGEFVMTRDAVEGAGGGDVNKGLNRMYSMMDKFEGMA
jgi:hypothetical protein|tara:strand:+ start:1859 stop:2713 length:855 start_codon:yes stop_codon:yes gene_type:complete